jgi:hypothetical protein
MCIVNWPKKLRRFITDDIKQHFVLTFPGKLAREHMQLEKREFPFHPQQCLKITSGIYDKTNSNQWNGQDTFTKQWSVSKQK